MRRARTCLFKWSLLSLAILAAVSLTGCDMLMGVIGGDKGTASLNVSPMSVSLSVGGDTMVVVTAKDKSGNVEGFDSYSFNPGIASTQQMGSSLLRVTAGSVGNTQIFISSFSGLNKTIQVSVTAGGGGGTGVLADAILNLSSPYSTSTSVGLSWNPVGSASTVYDIERSSMSTNYSYMSLVTGVSGSNYTDNTVMADTDYTYRVQARDGISMSPWSNSFNIKTPGTGTGLNSPPTSAPNVTFNTTETSVSLDWPSGVYNATLYKVERALLPTGGMAPVWDFSTSVNNTSFYDTNVMPGTAYQYRITAGNVYGMSAMSALVYPTTKSQNTGASFPAPNVYNTPSYNQVYLYWDPVYMNVSPYTSAPSYRVSKWDDLMQTYTQLSTDPWNVTNFTDTNVTANKSYYYIVTAVDSSNADQQYAYVTVTTPMDPNSAPTSYPTLYLYSQSQSSITLYWDSMSVNGVSVNYRIARSDVNTNTDPAAGTWVDNGSSTYYYDTNITPAGTGYYYKIQAYNSSGSGPWSYYPTWFSTLAATDPPAMPSTPYLMNQEGISPAITLNLTWGDVGATEYVLQVSTDNMTWTDSTYATNSGSISGAMVGMTYYFRVFARNAYGASAVSGTGYYTVPASTVPVIIRVN